MPDDDAGRGSAAPGIDYRRIAGMDSAGNWLLGRNRAGAGCQRGRLAIPFLVDLRTPEARRTFRALPPIAGGSDNGAMIIGGDDVEALTAGRIVAAMAPVAWFERLAGPDAEKDRRLAAFRDAEKSIVLSTPVRLEAKPAGRLGRLPPVLAFGEPADMADMVRAAPGSVCIGLIDDGIAIAHERLRGPGGTSRVAWFWDQNRIDLAALLDADAAARPEIPGEISRRRLERLFATPAAKCDEDAIYRALGLLDFRDGRPRTLAQRVAHGAHVADLAAGYDPDDGSGALRPVIGVQLPSPVVARPVDDGNLEFYIWLAIVYIVLRADRLAADNARLPVVINASFGNLASPHDGTGVLEAAIETLLLSREGQVQLVLPAGNQHLSGCHAEVGFETTREVAFDWIVLPDDRTYSTLQVWMPAGDGGDITLRLTLPDGRTEAVIPVSGTACGATLPSTEIRYFGKAVGLMEMVETIEGRRMIRIDIGPTAPDLRAAVEHGIAPAGRWTLEFSLASGALGGAIHVWAQRDDSLYGYPQAGRQSFFDHPGYLRYASMISTGPGATLEIEEDSHPEQAASPSPIRRASLLNGIACGESVRVAGGYLLRERRIAPYSAGGPNTPADGGPAPAGPEVLLLSEDSRVLPGILAAGSRSGSTVALGGTSVAAPQLARRLADRLANRIQAGQSVGPDTDADHPAAVQPQGGATPRTGAGLLPPLQAEAARRRIIR